MRYEVEVTEIHHIQVVYEIEADSAGEAAEYAEIGETYSETTVRNLGVMGRIVESSPIEITD